MAEHKFRLYQFDITCEVNMMTESTRNDMTIFAPKRIELVYWAQRQFYFMPTWENYQTWNAKSVCYVANELILGGISLCICQVQRLLA